MDTVIDTNKDAPFTMGHLKIYHIKNIKLIKKIKSLRGESEASFTSVDGALKWLKDLKKRA